MNTAKIGRPPILTDRILEEVRKAAWDGIDSRQIHDNIARDITAQSIRTTLSRLVVGGRIFCDDNSTRKYFIRKEWAEASPVKPRHKVRHWADKYSDQLLSDCLKLVNQSGADGISNDVAAQILGRHVRTLQTAYGRMVKNGDIFIARVGNHHKYFSVKEYAEAYSNKQKKRQKKILTEKTKQEKQVIENKYAVAKKPAALPAPVIVKQEKQSWIHAEVLTPANVKKTIAVAPPGRFEVTGPVIGGFKNMGIGRYLEAA